jgi:hypothetical protein
METDVSWTQPARHYAQIFREIAPASQDAAS